MSERMEIRTETYVILEDGECVINDPQNYETLARILRDEHAVLFAWSDRHDTQLDLILNYAPTAFGRTIEGFDESPHLLVSVVSFGAYGFPLDGRRHDPRVVGAELETGINPATEQLTDLINGICLELEQ
jgi:hypothetical protein